MKKTWNLKVDKEGVLTFPDDLIRTILRQQGIISKKRRIIKKTLKKTLNRAFKELLKNSPIP